MTIPAAGHIEMAADMLSQEPFTELLDMLKEFQEFGPGRQARLLSDLSKLLGASEMSAGYILGFETARAMLKMMPAASQAGVTL